MDYSNSGSSEHEWLRLYKCDPLHQSVENELCEQIQDLNLHRKRLSDVEQQIQELMDERENLLFELEEKKASADNIQQKVFDCRKMIRDRWHLISKQHNFTADYFSLFCLLPSELYVHVFKYFTPKELCYGMMMVSKYCYDVSKTDEIWGTMYNKVYGVPDDLSCIVCADAEPKKRKNKQARNNPTIDDIDMSDALAGVSVISLSGSGDVKQQNGDSPWLKAFKHRVELDKQWKKGQPLSKLTLNGHTDWVTGLIMRGDQLISGSFDSTIRVWNMNNGECVHLLTGHTAGINDMAMTSDESIVASGALDFTIRLWETNAYTCKTVLEGHADQVSFVRFVRHKSQPKWNNILVSGALDNTLRVWDITTGKCVYVLQGHTQGITALEGSQQYFASGSADGSIMVWDVSQGKLMAPLLGHSDRITALNIDIDKKRLISASWDFTTRVWDLATGTCLHVLKGHVFRVRCISVFGNTLVTGSWDSELKVWDLQTGRNLRTLTGHSNYVWDCELQNEGKRIISSSWDRSIRVWDLQANKCVAYLEHVGEVLKLTTSTHRIIGASKEITIWNF